MLNAEQISIADHVRRNQNTKERHSPQAAGTCCMQTTVKVLLGWRLLSRTAAEIPAGCS